MHNFYKRTTQTLDRQHPRGCTPLRRQAFDLYLNRPTCTAVAPAIDPGERGVAVEPLVAAGQGAKLPPPKLKAFCPFFVRKHGQKLEDLNDKNCHRLHAVATTS